MLFIKEFEICAAYHRANEVEDFSWHRVAMVRPNRQKRFEADRPRRCEFFFVDNGKRDWVDIKNIRIIVKKFTSLPVQVRFL